MLAPFAVYICQVNNAPLSNTLEQTYSVYLPFEGSRHLFDHAPHSLLSRQLIASCIFLPFRILERNCREYKTSNLECWKEKSNKWREKFSLSSKWKFRSIVQRFQSSLHATSFLEMKANSSLKIRDA